MQPSKDLPAFFANWWPNGPVEIMTEIRPLPPEDQIQLLRGFGGEPIPTAPAPDEPIIATGYTLGPLVPCPPMGYKLSDAARKELEAWRKPEVPETPPHLQRVQLAHEGPAPKPAPEEPAPAPEELAGGRGVG